MPAPQTAPADAADRLAFACAVFADALRLRHRAGGGPLISEATRRADVEVHRAVQRAIRLACPR